jgi:DNA-binding beta-propeller fold protein YncE
MLWAAVLALSLTTGAAALAQEDEGRRPAAARAVAEPPKPKVDPSKLVWPSPPDIARIKWLAQVSSQDDLVPPAKKEKKKRSWMDRLAGISLPGEVEKKALALSKPFGVAADSKGRIYVADIGVRQVFVFDLEKKTTEFLPGPFVSPIGVAVDDADRVFVVDSRLRQITAYSPKWEVEGTFGTDHLKRPVSAAVDNENRFLYVVDVDASRLAVFDADKFTFLRYLGQPSDPLNPEPGTFSKPLGVAVDADGNVYVTDTMNDRVQIFDPDGNFIQMFGKQGVLPGMFMRAKGIAVDVDGHVYVTDSDFNNVQVLDREGRPLGVFGSRGTEPGQFSLVTGIYVDSLNRILVADQWRARVQVFGYVTDAEAAAQLKARGQTPPAAAIRPERNSAPPQ